MPNTKSAMKRQRQSVEATLLNKSKKTRIHSAKRAFDAAVETGDSAKAQAACSTLFSTLDKGAKAKVIKSNTADRGKARAVKALSKMKA